MIKKFIFIILALAAFWSAFRLGWLDEPIGRIKSESFAKQAYHASAIERKAISALYYKHLLDPCNQKTIQKLTRILNKTDSYNISFEISYKVMESCALSEREKRRAALSLLVFAKNSSNSVYIKDAIQYVEKSKIESTQIKIESAMAYQKIGDHGKAVELFFEVFSGVSLKNVSRNLIFEYFKALELEKSFCSAGKLLRGALQNKAFSDKSYVVAEIKRVEKKGECERGEVSTPIIAKFYGSHAFLDVTVGDKTGKFLIDTGATTTTVKSSFLKFVNDRYKSNSRPVKVHTAGGPVQAQLLTISTGSVSSVALSHFRVVSVDTMDEIPDFDGLLGMNVLSLFSIDMQSDKVILKKPNF